MKMDFTQPPPKAKDLAESQTLINVLWKTCSEIKEVKQKNAELEERLNTNSKNSSLPPSKDNKKKIAKKKSKKTKKKRGGQPGHRIHKRALAPIEQVDVIKKCTPNKQCRCGGLIHSNQAFRRHQKYELPVIKPIITEYQIYSGNCCICKKEYKGRLPSSVPNSMLGARAVATIATLTGNYRMSKRNVVNLFDDIYGFKISVGLVSKSEKTASCALEQPVEEAKQFIKGIDNVQVHADETGHKESGKKMWAWVAVALLVSVFIIRASRGTQVAKELLGDAFKGILNSDRWCAYNWVDQKRRQLCWAHLDRDFTKISERKGTSKIVGEALLDKTDKMFSYWHKVKNGDKTRTQFQKYMRILRADIESLLIRGTRCKNRKTAGTCRHILGLKSALWTFIDHVDIEPTNNTAEQVIRTHVIWNKTSFGTQSPAGTLYMERILTTVGTCKLQKRNVLNFMTDVIQKYFKNEPAPSLLPEHNSQEIQKAA